MGGKRRKPRTLLGRFVLGRRLDRNPLRRASDRAETVLLAVLVITFLAVAPFAGRVAGAWAEGKAHQIQLQQEASWRQVPAVVLKAASAQQEGYAAVQADAQARWTAPTGEVVTGQIPVALGTAVGATVLVWVNRDGQLTDPPLQDSQVSGQVVFTGVFSVVALGVVLISIGALTRRALDKRRMAAWDADWRATGPRLTQ